MANFIKGTGHIVNNGDEVTPLKHAIEIQDEYLGDSSFLPFMGSSNKPIILNVSEFSSKEAGDTARFHFIAQDKGEGIDGQDSSTEGNEDDLQEFVTDVRIDQVRKAFKKKGKMTQKRIIWNFRTVAKKQLVNWFTDRTEKDIAAAMSGIITDGVTKLKGSQITTSPRIKGEGRCAIIKTTAGKSTLTAVAPADSSNSFISANITSTDIMTCSVLDRLVILAKRANPKYMIKPCRLDGGKKVYFLFVAPEVAVSLRQDPRWETRANSSIAGGVKLGEDVISTGLVGIWNNIVVVENDYIETFKSADGTKAIARNILAGDGAVIMGIAQKFDYSEELKDHGNVLSCQGDEIRGVKAMDYDNVTMNLAHIHCAIEKM